MEPELLEALMKAKVFGRLDELRLLIPPKLPDQNAVDPRLGERYAHILVGYRRKSSP